MDTCLLAIDQGTTSTRAIVYDACLRVLAEARQEFAQHFPRPGWVEHDPEDLWASTLATCREALAQAGVAPSAVAGAGITNQRETTVLWERASGRAIHPAIVWQDRRSASLCATLRERGLEALVTERTGLLLDPYFSATKIAWLLDHVEGARAQARRGRLAFGTVDSFLLWRLTDGRVHATDATNASRTLLYDIGRGCWDEELLEVFDIPESLLPEVRDSAADFGTSEAALLGAPIAIAGIAGDQQAATVGQACFSPGMIKSTYGTGCFAVLNTGLERVRSAHRLLTTVAYRLDGRATYALEGSIFVAGAAVQWLRDGLGLVKASSEVGPLAARADPQQELYLVPAFTGLGAPYWDAEARGAVFGLTRASGAAELARATLESVGFQTRDLLEAMRKDWPGAGTDTVLRVDGGMVASDWAMQFLADILAVPVDRPRSLETTARGAAYLAGLSQGLCPSPADFEAAWERERRFEPRMAAGERERRYAGWKDAVRRTLSAR